MPTWPRGPIVPTGIEIADGVVVAAEAAEDEAAEDDEVVGPALCAQKRIIPA